MQRILAIDWDRNEVRGVLLRSSGPTGRAVIGAWAASLTTADPNGLSGKQIGGRLAAAMSGYSLGKVTTLVAVGRDHVQIKLLSLPPAPAEELPDLVRFQAEREFTALGADAALDYVPISGNSDTPNQVLALALSPAGVSEAREICEALGIETDRIEVRGCAAAAFANRASGITANEVALIVNPLAEEADLVVQADDKVILLRTVRLPDPSQTEGRQRALIGEIRRTIAAVRQQLTDRQVDKVIICGNEPSIGRSSNLADELKVAVALIDPVAQTPAGLSSQNVPAESLGRFAAALGMAVSEAERRPPIVDFANVRKRVEVRRFSRVHILAAGVAAAAVLWFGAHVWQQISAPTRELAELQARIRDVESQAETYKDVTAQAAIVERWTATDVNWLDELEKTAKRVRPKPLADKDFPVANDTVLTQLRIFRPTGVDAAGGRLHLQGVARNSAAVRDLEDRLGDEKHRVIPGLGKTDKSIPGYDWSFDLEVRVPRPEEELAEAAKP
jgi:Tfp pilus assembly PilM family ATPase/Tfp pilus assembly protein PilN